MTSTIFCKALRYALSLLLIVVLGTNLAPALATTSKAEKEVRRVEKIKANIQKLGVGTESRIVVKLRDKRTIAGHISAINDDTFVITEAKTGAATTIPYPAVTAAKGSNKALWITLGAVGVGVLIVWLTIIRPYCNNEGC